MIPATLLALLRTRHKRAQLRIMSLMKAQARMVVYHALIETGLGVMLREWTTPDKAAESLGLNGL